MPLLELCIEGRQHLRLSKLNGAQILVHGVARPQRPTEFESPFVFLVGPEQACTAEWLLHVELVLPHLHATRRRVIADESALVLGTSDSSAAAGSARTADGGQTRADHEREILGRVREGKSNLEIGPVLDISALTGKNHLQKIPLRKLGASNRAQAVALAMAR